MKAFPADKFSINLMADNSVTIQLYCKNIKDATQLYEEMSLFCKSGKLVLELPVEVNKK